MKKVSKDLIVDIVLYAIGCLVAYRWGYNARREDEKHGCQ